MNQTQKWLLIGSAAVVALASTAVASSYITRQSEPVQLAQNDAAAPAAKAPAPVHHTAHRKAPCNDHNIIGTAGGALAGGLVGNQFGKGTGKTVATVGGAAGGAYLGNEYIPTRGATCN